MPAAKTLAILVTTVAVALGPVPASASVAGSDRRANDCQSRGWLHASVAIGAACTDVRPGGPVWTERVLADEPCTLNFLFKGYRIDEEGRRVETGTYMGTAGHCILAEGEEVWAAGEGPPAWDAEDRQLGRFAYSANAGDADFALIRLDEGVEASPQMCEFGGPTGINTQLTSDPEIVRYSGQGIGIRDVASGRQGLARNMSDPYVVYALGAAINGDSGSPAIDEEGKAVGVVVAIAAQTNPPEANVRITRLGPQITRAAELLEMELELQTSPLSAR
ncbi:MAG: trypsin-like serine protease [Actinomycetota bacterium]